jgi:Fur family ferric uptake transcriptional regulator
MDVADSLREHGMRRTPQRIAVIHALQSDRALSAHEVHERARKQGIELGLSTVYRTLVALADAGMIDAIGQHEGEATYRLCSGHHHHHLVCRACRTVVELEGCDLSPIEAAISSEHDFDVEGHSVTFSGLCAACRSQTANGGR